jgi:signal transduction histidine kinase
MPPPQLEVVDVNQVVRQALKLLEPQMAGRVRCDLALDGGVPSIQADPEQLAGVLRNLILNAMDAMPDGGTVTVRTSVQLDGVRLEVADTGAGLTPEERERLFTPYYTTKRHGTGLGLAIVQSVVSDHHGRISVESEPGRGATFRIDLPCLIS